MAAIADLHLHEPRDWRPIAALYQTLAQQTRCPIVEMNRAVAVAQIDGPEAGLAILDRLDLDHYRYLHLPVCRAPSQTLRRSRWSYLRSAAMPGKDLRRAGLCWADGIDGPRPGLQVWLRRTEVDHAPQTQLKEEIDAISGIGAPRVAART